MGSYGSPELGTGRNIKSEFYKCKKCGAEYFKDWENCPKCRTPKGKGSIRPIFIVLLIISIIALSIDIYYQNGEPLFPIPNHNQTEISINTIDSELPPVFPPETGIYQLFTDEDLLAPFKTINNDSGKLYLLKFVDSNSNSVVLTIFLNMNSNCDVKVPLGSYQLLIASGYTWYGDEYLFGDSCVYEKTDNIYDFYSDGKFYNGKALDMHAISSGYLEKITKENFE